MSDTETIPLPAHVTLETVDRLLKRAYQAALEPGHTLEVVDLIQAASEQIAHRLATDVKTPAVSDAIAAVAANNVRHVLSELEVR